MIKNKKGDVAITLFVIMVVALSGTVLTMMFLADKDIKKELKTPEELSNVYAEAESLNFLMNYELKQAIIDSYEDIVGSKEYISFSPNCLIDGQEFFCSLNPGLNNLLQHEVQSRFLQNIDFSSFIDDIEEKGMSISMDFGNLKFDYEDSFKTSLDNITLVYDSEKKTGVKGLILRHDFNIVQDIDFDDVELDSFEDIYSLAESCSNKNFSECFMLKHFDAAIEETTIADETFYKVNLTSKTDLSFTTGEKWERLSFFSKASILLTLQKYSNKEYSKLEFSFLVKKNKS